MKKAKDDKRLQTIPEGSYEAGGYEPGAEKE